MRAAQCRHLFRAAEAEAAFLRTECFQRRAKSRAAEGRIQIPQDPYDRAWPAQLSSSRHPMGDRAPSTTWSIKMSCQRRRVENIRIRGYDRGNAPWGTILHRRP